MISKREEHLLSTLTETSGRFYRWIALLLAIVLWGLYAYVHQLRHGLVVTGMRDEVSWGLYITNFVFFIGISHAGTLISAILRVTHTEWRRPITRLAEAITVFALCIGGPMVIIDLGRPERMLNLFRYGRIQSPILWDVLSVSTYLTGCILYLYIPMIPDFAMLAERSSLGAWRRRLYKKLSLGWTGSPQQWTLLERSISVMAVVIIPLAISVHTVVSWIFAMTLRPGWNSSIFGPYFVVGAIYSGAAAVIFSMYVLRRVLRLQDYLQPVHFRNLGLLLLSFALLYLYFNINEYLTMGYKFEGIEKEYLTRLFFGDYAPMFWTVQAVGVFIPALLLMAVLGLGRHQSFTIPGVALASFLAIVGAWAKRYLIVVPTLSSPFLPGQRIPWEWTHYRPTWVEWSVTAAAVAVFLLIYALFSKLFPMVSIWETRDPDAVPVEAEAAAPAPRGWGAISSIPIILITLTLAGASLAHAGETRKPRKPAPTALSLEWQALPADKLAAASAEEEPPDAITAGRVQHSLSQLFGQLHFGSKNAEEQKPPSAIALKATLKDERGAPVAMQPVSFSLRTSFGLVQYGSRPTNEEGKAELVVRERRYGRYPVLVAYGGDEAFGGTRAEISVDFGLRPAPGLPTAGVLIAPYATAAIGLPFVIFYGIMWVVYLYAFGYLILWRVRRAGREKHPN
ncbi:MAG: polysulfide reductase NrfD [Acidobacteriia bacterium]|nr:polysulfide reductase NrfD [Terriglobia bacterium]